MVEVGRVRRRRFMRNQEVVEEQAPYRYLPATAVVDALVPYVKKLTDTAQEKVTVALSICSEITKLEGIMEDIRAFFDANRWHISDQRVHGLELKLKNAIYVATDILELCLLKAGKQSEEKVEPSEHSRLEEPSCFLALFFCLRNPLFAHDINNRFIQLKQQLGSIQDEMDKYRFTFRSITGPMWSELSSRYNTIKMTPEFSELGIAGEQIEEDTKKLAHITTNGNHNMEVVSIIGIAGIGKTILAQKIFNEPAIEQHFKMKIWLSITQCFDKAELLKTAIEQAGGVHGGEQHEDILMETLTDTLSMGRFLLVMDDVWSDEAWSHVLSVPVLIASRIQPGSRVLVTTRSADIPQRMQAPLHQHRVRPLDKDDAWCLLKKQLPPDNQVVGIDRLKDIGMEILERCDGIPLAIKVVGGLLSTSRPRKSEWMNVLSNRLSEVDRRLYLSYEDLSPQLKQCFLYCSLFPKGQKIAQRTIAEMWASEGFTTTSSREHEDIAIEYYQELMGRTLIEPAEKYSLTGYTCSMHNVVRSFAEYVSREEALVVQREQQIRNIDGQYNSLRRLSIQLTESIQVEWAALPRLVSLRVLIINCKINFKPGDSLSSFSSLRVLHIVRLSDSDTLVSSLCQLKLLRYLYLYDSDISRLPDDIDRMKFLQYIGVVNCERFVQLPGNLVKLRQLRSLDLVGSNVHAVPMGFSSLTNLRSLFGFPVYTDNSRGQNWCSLEELAPLSQLRCLRLDGVENVDTSQLAAEAMISSKQNLRSLQLNYSGSTRRSSNVSNLQEEQQLIQEVCEHQNPPTCLETLVMEGYTGSQLPNWMWAPKAADFRSMRYMSLHNLASCTHLPDGLCQMPSLERLEINKAPLIRHVGPEFQQNSGLGYTFPRLQELVFYGMVEWCDWEWEPLDDVQAMPKLEVLLVESCKLRILPPGLSYHARALRRLVITGARLLIFLEDLPSLVELDICICTELISICNLPSLHKLTVKICPNLKVLKGVPLLDTLVVEDYRMTTLPDYLQCVNPRSLTLHCTMKLFKSISMGKGGPEWDKFSHIKRVNFSAYAKDGGGYPMKGSYTRDPFSFETMLNSEDELTDDEPVGSDIPSGSAVNPADELVGSDILSGYTDELTDDEPVGSDIPSGSAVNLADELVGSDILSGYTEVGSELVFPEKNDSELVGIKKSCKEIIKMLMCDQDMGKKQLHVVSICGIGGLGKTSIAEAIYKHIRDQFKCCAFVLVSQTHAEDKGLIKDIFKQVECPYPSFEDVSQEPTEQLIVQLKEFLQDKRYLIVLDDIRDLSAWEMIKPALVGNNQGSGIITTTYKVDVAESIGGVYRLPLLSNEDSKMLFYRRTYFRSEDGCPSVYRELIKRILNKCGRLPLAIITFASLLPNNSPNSLEEWKRVADSIGSGSSKLGDGVKNMRRILSRSYDNLPQELRTCFLYLCTFSEDYVIRRDTLVRRWISEDLIHGNDDGQNLQELGERYFYDLLDTGMIQPIEHDYDGKALACRVPVLMTDLIFSFANNNKEETCSDEEETRSHEEETTKFLQWRSRSYISCSAYLKKDLKFKKNLRVLELEGPLGKQHAKYIGSLRQLRYLVLESTLITAIPRQVGNLRHLQTLDLRETSVHELPCTIVGLKQLRRLLVNRSTKVPAGISKLQALEELQDIDTTPDILEGICTLPELRVLRIAVRSWDESCGKPLPETLCKLSTTKLKHLSICTSYSLEFNTGNNDIRKVLQHIEKLEIQHSTFGTLPTWIKPSQTNNGFMKLSSLSIEVYLLEMEGLKILAAVPELIFLSLTAKGPTAQRGPEEMVATAKLVVPKGFGKLKTFHLFSRAIGIRFQQGSMENLESLKLSFQASLATDDFSFGVENLYSLKYIQVEIICFSATEEAVKKAEDAIKDMISRSPKQHRPALDIIRTAKEDTIKDKGEVKEECEFRELFLAALDSRVALAQKEKGKERISLSKEDEEKEKNA